MESLFFLKNLRPEFRTITPADLLHMSKEELNGLRLEVRDWVAAGENYKWRVYKDFEGNWELMRG